MKTHAEPVFVQSVESLPNKPVYRIVLIGLKTATEYVTYVDPSNRNFRKWRTVVELGNTHGIILNNTIFKDKKKNLINADSDLKIECVTSKEELADTVSEYWNAQKVFDGMFNKFNER